MRWIEVTIDFTAKVSAADFALDLVCDIFYSLGIKGVVIDDVPDNGGIAAKVSGYILKDAPAAATQEQIERMVAELVDRGVITASVHTRELDEQDWASFWKEHFHPVRIGRQLLVKPTWHDRQPVDGEVVIEIDPGMAFGTGTHATTAMCLEMIEELLRPDDTFLDIGTGSGILMIAAYKMGAAIVWGVDNDPMAVEIAAENLRLNRIPESNWMVVMTDPTASPFALPGIRRLFDLIAANIQSETVVELVPRAAELIVPGGLFVCSGIIEQKEDLVREALDRSGFTLLRKKNEQTWVCMAAQAS